jgi:hypothetical protein
MLALLVLAVAEKLAVLSWNDSVIEERLLCFSKADSERRVRVHRDPRGLCRVILAGAENQ